MTYQIQSLQKLVEALHRLPGIGPKTAERLAYYILKTNKEEVIDLSEAIKLAKESICYCSICNNVTDTDPCAICQNPERDHTQICVVEEPFDVRAVEKTRGLKGVYHVLLGALSPIEGIGPEDLKIKELLARLEKDKVREVIVATNPNVEGEATALYLSRLIKPLGVKVARIAYGLPIGSSLEYADEVTLSKALEGRKEL
ncbi:MAG: recombination protein RecR [Elusimicrobia bacterium]|nr:recombination protein RecR [Elusimicrobiota bacterium]